MIEGVKKIYLIVYEGNLGSLTLMARSIAGFIDGMTCAPIPRVPAADDWEAMVDIQK